MNPHEPSPPKHSPPLDNTDSKARSLLGRKQEERNYICMTKKKGKVMRY